MENVQVVENGTKLSSIPEYLRITGGFNYFVTVNVKGPPSTTSSAISIVCHSKAQRKAPVAALFRWFRGEHPEGAKSNFYQCGPRDRELTIKALVSPAEEGFSGDCKIIYGPVSLEPAAETALSNALKAGALFMRAQGVAEGGRVAFPLIEARPDKLRALDHRSAPLLETSIGKDLLVATSQTDPTAVKFFRVGGLEWSLKLASPAERDVLVLFVEKHKAAPLLDLPRPPSPTRPAPALTAIDAPASPDEPLELVLQRYLADGSAKPLAKPSAPSPNLTPTMPTAVLGRPAAIRRVDSAAIDRLILEEAEARGAAAQEAQRAVNEELARLRAANASLSRELKFFQNERAQRESAESALLEHSDAATSARIAELERHLRDINKEKQTAIERAESATRDLEEWRLRAEKEAEQSDKLRRLLDEKDARLAELTENSEYLASKNQLQSSRLESLESAIASWTRDKEQLAFVTAELRALQVASEQARLDRDLLASAAADHRVAAAAAAADAAAAKDAATAAAARTAVVQREKEELQRRVESLRRELALKQNTVADSVAVEAVETRLAETREKLVSAERQRVEAEARLTRAQAEAAEARESAARDAAELRAQRDFLDRVFQEKLALVESGQSKALAEQRRLADEKRGLARENAELSAKIAELNVALAAAQTRAAQLPEPSATSPGYSEEKLHILEVHRRNLEAQLERETQETETQRRRAKEAELALRALRDKTALASPVLAEPESLAAAKRAAAEANSRAELLLVQLDVAASEKRDLERRIGMLEARLLVEEENSQILSRTLDPQDGLLLESQRALVEAHKQLELAQAEVDSLTREKWQLAAQLQKQSEGPAGSRAESTDVQALKLENQRLMALNAQLREQALSAGDEELFKVVRGLEEGNSGPRERLLKLLREFDDLRPEKAKDLSAEEMWVKLENCLTGMADQLRTKEEWIEMMNQQILEEHTKNNSQKHHRNDSPSNTFN